MIMAQEREFLKAQSELQGIVEYVRQAAERGERIDQVERGLFRQLLGLGHTLLEAFVAGQGDGDVGPTAEPEEGREVRRLEEPHTRRYVSVFGELEITRRVYGTRAKQKIEHVPLDARLGLPAGEYSYVLEDWLERFSVQQSFAEAGGSLEALLGLKASVRTIEHMNREMATHAESFEAGRAPPPAEEEAAILVTTADGKGVPMRRPLDERVAGRHRRKKGEKANRKQMAYVGAVYTIAPFVRTADEVVDDLRRRRRGRDRPKPCHKRVWAEMTRVEEGETCNGRVSVFGKMASEAEARDPQRTKRRVCLLDGERALWEVKEFFLGDAVGILDIFHVMERLWQAAHCFHREGSAAAERWMEARLRMLLEGKVGRVIGGLRQMLTKQPLRGERRRTLASVVTYFENNRAHMRYDEYLAAGYPIGSGVAEGACRHLVKDRMERTGMRWTLEGAQSMLHLRALYLNNDWDAFVEYRVETEQARLYGKKAA